VTPDETVKQLAKFVKRRRSVIEEIAGAARPVVPVLLDAGLNNSAKGLQELFFQLDALEQELIVFTKENAAEMFAGIVSHPGWRR
jgi:hypothetical protein